jgi:hypothetical protein
VDEVITGNVFQPLSAHFHDLTCGQDSLQTQDMMPRDSLLDGASAACVLREVPPDEAGLEAHRIARVEKAECLNRLADLAGHDAGFHHGHHVFSVDLQNTVHALESQHNASEKRHGSAGQPRSPARGLTDMRCRLASFMILEISDADAGLTTTPAMGVPVTFSEINNVAAIAEIANPDGSLMPDLSFGTHFFQGLVEMDMFYMAVYPGKRKAIFNKLWLEKQPNILKDLVPEDKKYADVIRVCNIRNKDMLLIADIVSQQVICFAQS